MVIPGDLRTRSTKRATPPPQIRYQKQIALAELLLPRFLGDLESL